MEPYMQQARELWKRWRALPAGSKFSWAAGSALLLGLAGLLWWIAQPEYRVLYTGLAADEAGAITAKLQSKGITFRLASGGTTILVPADQAMQVHLDLTADGTPGSSKIGKGFDLFDQPMLGATPFAQNVNFLRAQQAELAKTIMQIDPVLYARVHIVRPEPSPFIRDQKPTTASVMVKLRPGATLNRNTIAGITALVSGSVEGLTKESVRVVDANGRLLSDQHDPETGLGGSIIEQRKEVEHYLAGEAERVLTHVLGSGRAIVRVTAELNTKLMREKREIINAEGKVARSEKLTVNKTSSAGAKGMVSGPAGKGAAGAPAGNSTTNQETQQSDYDYPRTIQEWQHKQGSIERLTVAAFVDTTDAKGEQIVPLADVQEIIKKAIGFKSDRDEIQVTQVRVPAPSSALFDEEWASHQKWQTVLTFIRNSSITMMTLCGCLIVWMLLRRRAAPPAPATAAATEAAPDPLQKVRGELDQNPQMLSKILERWLESQDASHRAAA